MWAINNQTRFKADRAFVRDTEGAEIWIVAVRATFSLMGNDELVIAETQEDVCLSPVYFSEPGQSSLRYDTDMVRTKSGTDVILNACAHAPGGRRASFVDVFASVGPMSKQIHVVGDRIWEKHPWSLVPSDPVPFITMPIRYERAWGGHLAEKDVLDPFNPVGVGRSLRPGSPVPNCEHPDSPIRSQHYKGVPAGFGAIPGHWQPRVRLAGTYDQAWRQKRQPLAPVDFNEEYFRCAPDDQQIRGFLSGGEEVILRNLTPEGFVRFRLPRIRIGFTTYIDGGTVHQRGELYSVIIEPEARQVVLVWQATLACHHTLYTLKETVVFEKRQLNNELEEEPADETDSRQRVQQ